VVPTWLENALTAAPLLGGFRDFQMGSAIAPDARPLRCAGAAAISKQGAARGGDFQLAMDAADDLRPRAAW